MFQHSCMIVLTTLLLATQLRAGNDAPEPRYEGKTLTEWLKALDSSDKSERDSARRALPMLLSKTQARVPEVVRSLLRQADESTVDLVASIGAAAVPTLRAELWQGKDSRYVVLHCLKRIGRKSRPAAQSLLAIVRNDDEPFAARQMALEVLVAMSARHAIPDILPLLEAKDAALQEVVAGALLSLEVEARDILPTALLWLKSEETGRRRLGVRILEALGPEAAPALPQLIKALDDDDGVVKIFALRSLSSMGSAAREAGPAIRRLPMPFRNLVPAALYQLGDREGAAALAKELLPKTEGRERVYLAAALWTIDRSPEALAALRDGLKSDNAEVREAALDRVPAGKEAIAALPELGAILKDEKQRVRTATLLAQFGPAAKPVLELLQSVAKDETDYARPAALRALWNIDKRPTAIASLTSLLDDKDPILAMLAAGQLADIGSEARAAVPSLVKRLKHADASVRTNAALALARLGMDSEAARAALFALLREETDVGIRQTVASELSAHWPDRAEEVIKVLRPLLWDEEPLVRSGAAEGLGRFGDKARQAVPALIALLGDDAEEDFVHSAAAEALARIGDEARPARSALARRLQHPSDYVKVHAALALVTIANDKVGVSVAEHCLKSRRAQTRVCAAETLWRARQDRQAVPALIEILRQASVSEAPDASNVRYMAARALGRIGAPAREAMPALRELLNNPDQDLREMAADALSRIEKQEQP